MDGNMYRISETLKIALKIKFRSADSNLTIMFSWLSSFTISQKRQWVIRESVVEASTYISATKAEREEVYRMWEASEFRDPDLRHKHLDLDASVEVTEQVIERLLKFLSADERAAYKKQSAKAEPPIRLKSD